MVKPGNIYRRSMDLPLTVPVTVTLPNSCQVLVKRPVVVTANCTGVLVMTVPEAAGIAMEWVRIAAASIKQRTVAHRGHCFQTDFLWKM